MKHGTTAVCVGYAGACGIEFMENKHYFAFLIVYMCLTSFFISFSQMDERLRFYIPQSDHDNYPNGAVSIIETITRVFGLEPIFTALLLLFCLVLLPSLLIRVLAGNLAGVFYLLSGIPFILLDGANIAQSIIHFLMLLSLLWSPFYLLFACIGGEIHREWFYAFVLTFVFDFVRGYSGLGKIL